MKQKASPSVFLRIFLCLLILGTGFCGFFVLKKMKKPPLLVEEKERPLLVQVVQVRSEQVPVLVSGYGEIRSRTMVPLSAEVTGRITSQHRDLEVGAVIRKGEVLCTINERDFQLELETAQARLQSLSRDLALARREFARVSELYRKNRVGTLSTVEKAERSVNGIVNQRVQVQHALELARLHLERCVIRAPFTGRITELNMEVNEYVTPGRKLLTMVDDADLEIEVSLDSRDAVNWLRFRPSVENSTWFGLPEKTGCTVTWTERKDVHGKGRLDRVVRFDSTTRTLVVAVRLEPRNSTPFPLVQGMFCRVDIVGRSLEKVFILPGQAVTYEGNVHVVQDSRLHTRKVEVARVQDNKALVTGGLREGETVIITRLENPLENTLVRIEEAGDPGR